MSNKVAITIGDIKGIGLQILLETWKDKKIKNFILFSDIKYLKKHINNKISNDEINIINSKNNIKNYHNFKINIYSYNSKSSEDNTYKSLKHAYYFCKRKLCKGIITLPLRKDLIIKKINKHFIGQTEYFQNIDKRKNSNMILFHNKIIISPLTTHIKIKNISKIISNKNFLINQIKNLHKTLKIDFNIKNPKLILSGLNPHAGENGNIGLEEEKVIKPIVKKLKKNNIKIEGPLSADSILIKKNLKIYDCFIFIYHDQALIPFKYISQFNGVNYTGNLSIIRTSPDHGTAYDLVGSKNISKKSFINCYRLVNKIYRNRIMNAES